MQLDGGLGHLTYSTLVHPGDTWDQMAASVAAHVPRVKARVSPLEPMGVSLRLSGAAVESLTSDPVEQTRFCSWLRTKGLYVYTVNAFPHGPFKGGPVMERVYEPDWTTDARTTYTMAVADLLATMTPDHVDPSIQTSPLAFRPNVTGGDYVECFTENLFRVVAHLASLERRTGRRIKLALEPEPFCFLETTAETVAYFEEHVFSRAAATRLSRLADVPASESVGLTRRHLGVVFDMGHQSVAFEEIPVALESLVAAGIPIFKLQAAAALWVPEVTEDALAGLERFTDTIYLSQTTERCGDQVTHYLNLADAIAAYRAAPGGRREWRTHFHLPVFLDQIGGFRTTRQDVEAALRLHSRSPLSDHLEIETYTWDVLPDELKTGDVDEYVSREVEWVRDTLMPRREGAAPASGSVR